MYEEARPVMHPTDNGVLVPVGGGDAIPLIRETLTLGRRESCDICLRFPNVSGLHCELTFKDGCWTIRDKNSTNGIKVNGARVQKKVLHPGDTITIAKRSFTIEYNLTVGKQALAEMMEDSADLIDIPLLQKAGLARPEDLDKKPKQRKPWDDIEDDDPETE
jgi:pSer/pThr/pTyr-binding forkhead associated (FHA) protein